MRRRFSSRSRAATVKRAALCPLIALCGPSRWAPTKTCTVAFLCVCVCVFVCVYLSCLCAYLRVFVCMCMWVNMLSWFGHVFVLFVSTAAHFIRERVFSCFCDRVYVIDVLSIIHACVFRWANAWFQTLRTAYGMFLYADKTNNATLRAQSLSVLQLHLQAPRSPFGPTPV